MKPFQQSNALKDFIFSFDCTQPFTLILNKKTAHGQKEQSAKTKCHLLQVWLNVSKTKFVETSIELNLPPMLNLTGVSYVVSKFTND